MNQRILRELKSNLESMSPVEKKIAEVILSEPKLVISFSLSEFSHVAQVSQGSIVNFSNKYCGGGFPVLKTAIATALSHQGESPFSVLQSGDSLDEVFHKTANNTVDALRNTAALNDADTLKAVCDMILAAKKIEIYGVFRSGTVAADFCYQLLQLGLPATFVSDVLTCAVTASMLEKEHLVIAISSSGQTRDVIDAVKLAKANGVPIVAITAYKSSPLAKLADRVLIAAPSGNSKSSAPTEIRTSQLTLTDAICSYLQNRTDANGKNGYYKICEILSLHKVKD